MKREARNSRSELFTVPPRNKQSVKNVPNEEQRRILGEQAAGPHSYGKCGLLPFVGQMSGVALYRQ